MHVYVFVSVCVCIFLTKNGSTDKTIVMRCVCDNFLFVEWERDYVLTSFCIVCVFMYRNICVFVDWNVHANALPISLSLSEWISSRPSKEIVQHAILWFILYVFVFFLFIWHFLFILLLSVCFFLFRARTFTKFRYFCFIFLSWSDKLFETLLVKNQLTK